MDRANKAFNSPYDFINCATWGLADMAKGAVAPDDPLSKEHWLNSFGLLSFVLGCQDLKRV